MPQKQPTKPRINATKGESWPINLDSMASGRAMLLNGDLEKNCGVKASMGVIVRRALQFYFDHVQGEVNSEKDWKEELDNLVQASGQDPEEVKKRLEKFNKQGETKSTGSVSKPPKTNRKIQVRL